MTTDGIKEPPRMLTGTIGYLGPGLIISASLVGAGELVATTKLGAEVGFTLLWLILVGCIIKVFVQIEMARYAIGTGETTLTAFNRIPGPLSLLGNQRIAQLPLFRANWVVAIWLIALALTYAAFGGIMGGVVQAAAIGFDVPQQGAAFVITIFTIVILVFGQYKGIELTATTLVVGFTFITLATAAALSATPFAPSAADVVEGLKFRFPEGGAALATALATFGLIGVTSGEIVGYPYWCVEKGYARFTGPRTSDEAWIARANGWVRVMKVDSLLALVIYTVATIAFYFIGAAVLNPQGLNPDGMELISTLIAAYTPVFGDIAKWLLVVGAVAVLYSTYFVAMAVSTRTLTDFSSIIGLVDRNDPAQMQRSVTRFAVLLPLFVLAIYWTGINPVRLIIIGGIAQALFLPIASLAVLYLRYRVTPAELRPGPLWDAALLASSATFVAVGLFSFFRFFA